MKTMVSPVNSLNPLRPGRVAPRDQTDPALETDGVSTMGWNGRKPTMDRPGHHGTRWERTFKGEPIEGTKSHVFSNVHSAFTARHALSKKISILRFHVCLKMGSQIQWLTLVNHYLKLMLIDVDFPHSTGYLGCHSTNSLGPQTPSRALASEHSAVPRLGRTLFGSPGREKHGEHVWQCLNTCEKPFGDHGWEF